jgi:hypothetical protein
MWSAGEADDKERFLADLRALRDTAALEFDELAARTHYPSDVLKEAESGPSLPGLPIVAAYVRACDGDVLEWEERWRRFGLEPPADPALPVRAAGASPAAAAGARAAVSVAPPDAYDPERIKAALRGSHGGSARSARGTASRAAADRDPPGAATAEPRVPESAASWSAATSWDGFRGDGFPRNAGEHWDGAAADLSGTPANGNHHVSHPADGSSDSAVVETPDAARTDAIRRDPFSAAWLQDGESTSPPDTASGWPDRAEAGPPAAVPDSWFTPREEADGERTWATTNAEPLDAATDSWFTPRERADSGLAPQEHTGSASAGVTGFWTPSAAASASAEVQQPGPAPVEGPAIRPAAWPAPAGTSASETLGAADRTMPVLAQAATADWTTPVPAQAATAAPSRTIAGPTVPPGPVIPPNKERSDRLYSARLLVIIVVAALIGSVLVLLLR